MTLWYGLALLLVLGLAQMYYMAPQGKTIPYSQFKELVKSGGIVAHQRPVRVEDGTQLDGPTRPDRPDEGFHGCGAGDHRRGRGVRAVAVLGPHVVVDRRVEPLDPLGAREHLFQRGQFVVFGRSQVCLFEFSQLEAREFDAGIPFGQHGAQPSEFAGGVLHGSKGNRDGVPDRLEAGKPIQSREMRRRVQQRLVFVLAVEFQESGRQFLQGGCGRQVAVDERAAPTLRRDFAPHQIFVGANLEDRLYCRCFFACPDEVA